MVDFGGLKAAKMFFRKEVFHFLLFDFDDSTDSTPRSSSCRPGLALFLGEGFDFGDAAGNQ